MTVQEALIINCRHLGVPLTVDIEPIRAYKHFPMDFQFVTLHNAAAKSNGFSVHNYNRYSIRTSGDGIKSWHFSVGEDGAYQALPLDLNGWHAGDEGGDGNLKSVGIEIARDLSDSPNLYDQAEDYGLRLAAALLVAKGLSIDRLRKHQDWSGKYCPHRILRENRWEAVKGRVSEYIAEINRLESQPEQKPQAKPIYHVQVGAFSNPKNAEKFCRNIQVALEAAGIYTKPFIKKG